MYPVNFLEELVREKTNPYGHTDIQDSVKHVRELRRESKDKTDEKFLEKIHILIKKMYALMQQQL